MNHNNKKKKNDYYAALLSEIYFYINLNTAIPYFRFILMEYILFML
jgi:hypothetical protein